MTNDKTIKEYLKEIEKRRVDLGEKPVIAWRTNNVYTSPGGITYNLNTIRNIDEFVTLYAIILRELELISKAGEELGVSTNIDKWKWDGYTQEEWKEDFKGKIKLLQWEEKKSQLKSAEAKLKALRSEDAKTADALDDIANILKI